MTSAKWRVSEGENYRTYQILSFNWPCTRSLVIRATLLRFSLASKTAVVDFEIRCGKNKKISWRLIPDALPENRSEGRVGDTSTELCLPKARRRL